MKDANAAIAITAEGGGEALDVLGAAMIVKSQTKEAFLAEHVIPPGYFVPPHMHADDEELFFILEGRLTLLDGGQEMVIGPGETARFPRGVAHGFRNDDAGAVRFLVLCTPGVQAGEMFRHFDRGGREAPLAPAAVGEICAQYGVRMA